MGIELALILPADCWVLLAGNSAIGRWLSSQFGITVGNSEIIWVLLGVAFFLLIVAFIGIFRPRYIPEDDELLDEDALVERIAQLERKVNRLAERTDSVEERLRIEVSSIGRSLSTILGRTEVGSTTEKGSDAARPRGPVESESRQSASRTDHVSLGPMSTPRAQQASLTQRLVATRRGILSKIKSAFAGDATIDSDMLEELEVLLVTSDLGLKTASALLRDLKATVREGGSLTKEGIIAHLHGQLLAVLNKVGDSAAAFQPFAKAPGEPKVLFVVGVNGVGKTTTVAKLAHQWTTQGARVVLAAADTFRAAADEQLREWGRRVGVQVVTGAPDDKPSTVAHAAVELARKERADIVLIDTAGRLHNRGSLMQELEGMVRAVKKLQPNSPEETWLVIDGTTGQNALVQAREFQSSVPLTGVIITKLDGTAKGGVVVAVTEELGIPVRFIGIGERWDDLRPFDASEFVTALLGDGSLSSIEA